MSVVSEQIDFFSIIGAQRSGSTYLYRLLEEHPQIVMNRPHRPEPKFFLKENHEKEDLLKYLNKYYSHSENPGQIYGEKSTSYLEYPVSGINILSHFPSAKAIVILRNPVHRAISNYSFSLENGLEERSPKEALDIQKEKDLNYNHEISVSPYAYVSRGRYINYLKPFAENFSSNLKVVILENILDDPQKIQEIYRFLNVDPSYVPKKTKSIFNSSPEIKVPDKTIEKLNEFYAPYNKELAEYFDLSIEKWR